MHLIEILLPVNDNDGRAFEASKFAAVRKQLTEKYGRVTAFTRAPAQGTNDSGGKVQHDDIVIMEVMTDTLDQDWWAAYRQNLECEFAQDEIVIRAIAMTKL
jgi:hypothetical protein